MEISPEASQQPCRVATKSSLIDEKSEAQRVGEEEKEGKGETEKPEEPTEGMLAYRRGNRPRACMLQGASLSALLNSGASSPVSCMVLCLRDSTVICLSILCLV